MQIHRGPESVQGSEAWHQFRQSRGGASEAPAVISWGHYPYDPKSPEALALVKLGYKQKPQTFAMSEGNRLEPRARELASQEFGINFVPMLISDGQMSASLDGADMFFNMIEIKVSSREIEELHDIYFPQFQQQMSVAGVSTMNLVAYRKESDAIDTKEVRFDDSVACEIRSGWDHFFNDVLPNVVAPGEALERNDPKWKNLAVSYIGTKAKMDALAEKLAQQREALLKEAGGSEVIGCGLSITATSGKLKTDYKALLEDHNIKEISKYQTRGKGGFQVNIKGAS